MRNLLLVGLLPAFLGLPRPGGPGSVEPIKLMPDVNILIYAHREDEKCHEAYAKWLKSLVDGAEPSR